MTGIGLTARQSELLRFIEDYTARRGYAPSYVEMMTAMAVTSKSNIHRLIVGLERRGRIRRLPRCARAIEVLGSAPRPGDAAPAASPAVLSSDVIHLRLYGRIA